MPSESESGRSPFLAAGVACTELIARPAEWINRRVETIELLSHEETRRRVSIDFTLSNDQLNELSIEDGIAVPISALTKEPRRNFDLRDETGRAIPVLGRWQNGELSHIAVMNGALKALPRDVTQDLFETVAADLRQIVSRHPRTRRTPWDVSSAGLKPGIAGAAPYGRTKHAACSWTRCAETTSCSR